MIRRKADTDPSVWPWIAFVTLASLLLSRAFACATPFAALAVLAALTLRPREAVTLLLATWLGNQAVGFVLMGYPWTPSTLGWGLAIGLAAVAGWGSALGAGRVVRGGPVSRIAVALVAADLAYELTLLLATTVLPSGPGAFTAAVVLRIFGINVAALGLLLAARRLADAAGVMPHVRSLSHRA